jgi:hypothetical protein
MHPTIADLEHAMRQAIGNPSSGILADTLPTLAAAAYATINPNSQTKPEQRILHPEETRTIHEP